MIKFIRTENLKAKKSGEYLIHLLAPIILVLGMLFLSFLYGFSEFRQIIYLLDLISIGLPFMISIVVTINIEQERQAGNFKGILLNENKLKYFFTKIFRLWVMGFLAIVFSVFLYELLIGNFNYMELVLKSILILTVTMLPTYLVHFFVDMRFSRNISIFLGAIEAMINAVFLTRLGDYLWKFFPCSWISRSLRYYSIIKLQNIKINIDYFSKTIVLIVTIIIVLFLLFWYRSWEGNNIEE